MSEKKTIESLMEQGRISGKLSTKDITDVLEDMEYDVDQMMRRSVKNRRLRSKTMTRSGTEMTWEVRLDNKQDLVALMLGIEGVHDATLVACQTEAGT